MTSKEVWMSNINFSNDDESSSKFSKWIVDLISRIWVKNELLSF